MSIDVTNIGVANKRVFCLSRARETDTRLRLAVPAETLRKLRS